MKYKCYCLSFLICLLIAPSLAQVDKIRQLSYQEIDSLVLIPLSKGAYQDAIPIMNIALEKARAEFGEMDSVAVEYMGNLAFLYSETGQYPKAESLFKKTIALKRKASIDFDIESVSLLNNTAVLYRRIGKYESAEDLYKQLLKIIEKNLGKKHKYYAVTLNNLAAAYQGMGKYQETEPLYLETRTILKELPGNEKAYANASNNLALLYQKTKRYTDAALLFEETLELRKAAYGENHPAFATTLDNLANLYQLLGKKDKVEKLLLQAQAIKKKFLGEEHPKYANSLNNLATFYKKNQQFEKAEKFMLQAKKIDEQTIGKKHPEYAHTLESLAGLYLKMERLDLALAYCWASFASNSDNFETIFPNLSTDSFELFVEHCSHLAAKDYLLLSKNNYQSDVRVNSSLKTLLLILRTGHQHDLNQAKTQQAAEKLSASFYVNKAAMEIFEKERNDFSGKENKLRIMESNSEFVEMGIQTVWEMGEPALYAEAFSFAAQNKSVLLADALKGNRARNLGDLPDSIVYQELDFQDKIDALKKQKYEAETPSQLEELIAKENRLNEDLALFLEKLKEKYPKYHHLKYANNTATAKEIQTLLDDKTLLLEYFVADTVTYLFVLSKEKVEMFPIAINKAKLKDQVKALRYALSDYRMITQKQDKAYALYIETAHWFYKALLEPLMQTLGEASKIENLILVTDGELGHIPFETFLVEAATQGELNYKELHYLVKDYNISYDYSATLWKENISAPRQRNNHEILACAAAYPSRKAGEDIDPTLLEIREEHVYNLRNMLLPLPAAQKEVESLSTHFAGRFVHNAFEQSGSQVASESYFKANAAQFGVIHLAMHGILHPEIPMLSSLAFTEDRDSLEDNFLQAYEISRLHLNADLVVLSACETGYGTFQQGEGVISLARSFMYAGVPSLVVSLWQVNDHSTALIMNSFYQKLSTGLAKDKALREAKLEYIKMAQGIVAHPAFWSPFIQLGDSRSIHLPQKGGLLMGYIVGGVVLLIGIVFLFRRKKESA